MASLELINYVPYLPNVSNDGVVTWEKDIACSSIENLPQLFWADGFPWTEANLWALERANSGTTDIKTVQSNLRHLHKYAKWLELTELDWRHFPILERNRALIRWRKELIKARDEFGLLAPSTATQRMNATINFYRYARINDLIVKDSPLWQDRLVVHRFHDKVGFERTMLMTSTDLAIPNRARRGLLLEDGLLPLTNQHMHQLLIFAEQENNCSKEMYLMLLLGFYSGARIETIADLKKGSLERAVSDSFAPGFKYIAVGPGSFPHVATKFDVEGQIMIPEWLFQKLADYVVDTRRLNREAIANRENKDLVFLTRFGHRYADRESINGTAVGRAMVDLRRAATHAGLKFMKNFRFHMTRATFGTWLTATLLQKGYDTKAVLEFVRDAMLHADIETTLRYIKFIERSAIKIEVANEFSVAFLGLKTRKENPCA